VRASETALQSQKDAFLSHYGTEGQRFESLLARQEVKQTSGFGFGVSGASNMSQEQRRT
jgi:hypothetical protein